jgi:hypothetical protein
MDVRGLRENAPTVAAAALLVTGGLVVVAGVSLVVAPLPRYFGYALPGTYRLLLAVLGVVGGAVHLLAGWLAHRRRHFFWTTFATGVGFVLVQATLPVDLAAVGLLWLGRDQFES